MSAVLNTSPPVKLLKPILVRMGPICYPSCHTLFKDWLLQKIKDKFPSPYICEDLGLLIEHGCKPYEEEILEEADSCCLREIGALLEAGASERQIADLLTALPQGYSPKSKKGRVKYPEIMKQFQTEKWNPAVWLLLRTWGPEEIAQQWRLSWLRKRVQKNESLCPPKEIFSHEGREVEVGYLRLRALFGVKHIPEVIQLLTTYCERAASFSDLQLGEELQVIMISHNYDHDPSESKIENENYRLYSPLVRTFKLTVKKQLELIARLRSHLEQQRWREALSLFTESFEKRELNAFRILMLHLEDWLSEHFIRTGSEEEEVQHLCDLYLAVDLNLIIPLLTVVPQQECDHLSAVCRSIQELHKFYRAFLSYREHRPGYDWLLLFAEGLWLRCYDLLSDRMCEEMLNALNTQLPLHTCSSSRYAWRIVHQLLQRRCPRKKQKHLEMLEEAIRLIHLNERKQGVVSLDRLCNNEFQWRGMLNRLLLPSRSNSPPAFSLTYGACSLHQLLSDTIDQNGQCIIPKQGKHSHPVKPIEGDGFDVHYKWKPRGFGLQLVSHYLFRTILIGHSPFLDMVKVARGEGFFQLSETISGKCLEDLLHKEIPEIDPLSFSQNFIRLLLDCEWDGKPNNYKAVKKGSAYALYNFDTEISFHPPYTITTTAQEVKVEVNMKSILFCFKNMKDPLHPAIVEHLKQLRIGKALCEVLILCQQARRRMINCFEEKEVSQQWEHKADPRYLGLPLQLRYLRDWYSRLWRLQNILKQNPPVPVTHWTILELFFPIIASQVRKAHSFNHPLKRFEHLYEKNYKVVSLQSRKTMITQHSKSVLLSCLSPEENPANASSIVYLDLDTAFGELSTLNKLSRKLDEKRKAIQGGNVEVFKELQDQEFRELVLWGNNQLKDQGFPELVLWGNNPHECLDWSRLNSATQSALLDAMKSLHWQRLYLGRCASLTKEILLSLLTDSPMLQVLDLTECSFCDETLALEISRKAPYLRELILSNSNLGSFYNPGRYLYHSPLNFPSLVRLEVNNCEQLVDFRLAASQLHLLSMNGCLRLSNFKMKASANCRIEMKKSRLKLGSEIGLLALAKSSASSDWNASLHHSARGRDGLTLLHRCVVHNFTQLARILCQEGANPNSGDHMGHTPLHLAAFLNKTQMVELLIQFGANLSHVDSFGNSPLHLATLWDNHGMVDLLLQHGANPFTENNDQLHAFHFAVLAIRQNQSESIRVFCDHIVKNKAGDLNALYEVLGGHTLLDVLAARNCHQSLRVFLNYIRATGQPARKTEAVHLAVSPLPAHILNPLRQIMKYVSLLRIAICPYLDRPDPLPEDTVDEEQKWTQFTEDLDEKAALRSSVCREATFEILRTNGFDVFQANNNGQTPLHLAAQHKYGSIITALLKLDVDINVSDQKGQTPLHLAAAEGFLEGVQILCATRNVNLDARETRCYTPLHLACMMGHIVVVRALLTSGADTTIRDLENKTAAEIATQYGHAEIAKLLI